MESRIIDKSPFTLNENEKYSHCLEIYTLLKLQKNKIRFYSYDKQILIYTKLFNSYYTHCEYKSNTLK